MGRPAPSRLACVCCRGLGVLPPGQDVDASIAKVVCEDCLPALIFGAPHPHRLSVAIRRELRA